MTRNDYILQATEAFVRETLAGEASGHDWWHIVRVRNMARTLAVEEGADVFLCELAALLHDIADEKISGSEEAGLVQVKEWLNSQTVSAEDTAHVLDILRTMSFKSHLAGQQTTSLEGRIVQDADRLDAIGAIGIARTMAYSGNKGRLIHDPEKAVREELTVTNYRSGEDTAILHFYEKLLKLKDLMNTETAKKMAQKRHDFMEQYLAQFYAEWDGKR